MRRVYAFLRISFIVTASVLGCLIITGVLGMTAYQKHLADGLDESYSAYSAMVDLNNVLSVVYLIPLIAGFVALIMWTRKAYIATESVAVDPYERRYSRGMAVGAWFIPIGNLFVPKRIISEIEKITSVAVSPERKGLSFTSQPLLKIGTWWWGLWIASRLMDRMSQSFATETDSDGLLTSDAYYRSASWSVFASALAMISIILGIGYLGKISGNVEVIEQRHREAN